MCLYFSKIRSLLILSALVGVKPMYLQAWSFFKMQMHTLL